MIDYFEINCFETNLKRLIFKTPHDNQTKFKISEQAQKYIEHGGKCALYLNGQELFDYKISGDALIYSDIPVEKNDLLELFYAPPSVDDLLELLTECKEHLIERHKITNQTICQQEQLK